MVTLKDIAIYLLIIFGGILLIETFSNFSFIENNILLKILTSIFIMIGCKIAITKLKDKKRVSSYIKRDLTNLNYSIVVERPLTFTEQLENLELDFGPFINGTSINSLKYKSQFKRFFIVKNENDYEFELIINIIQTWTGKFKFRIENTTRIRN